MFSFIREKLLKNTIGLHTLLPIILFIILVPHLSSVSVSFFLYIIFVLLWFTLHTLGIIPRPGKFIQFILLLISLVILIMNYGITFSQQASLSLLSMMICLKLLEIKNEQDRRNIFVILFLSYFILVIYFLHSQDLILTLFILINIILLTLMLSAFNRRPQKSLPLLDNFYLIGRLFLKALPIAIILFLFFPRIPGPLWSLPENGQSSTTGLSDKMYPGSVTDLASSDEIAFRVNFLGPPPSANKLYWRGPVLSETDGFLWSQKKQLSLNSQLHGRKFEDIITHTSDSIAYTITLEPHKKKWLFALEMPTRVNGDTIRGNYLSSDLQLLNKTNIHQLTQYQVLSTTEFKLHPVIKTELQDALIFPKTSNPKTYQLGKTWQNSFTSKKEIVSTGLNYFKNKPFFYTKQPNAMIDNPSDQFLFDEKRGFCEHYASSFVLLMRAAGIPARVVTGYQGIEKNNVGNYYIVRQSNAHAWAEVWLEEDGWIRLDPTAMIPPHRIEPDIFQTNLERLSFSSLNLPDLPKLSAQQKTALYNFSQQLKQSMDNLKNNWNNWILGYDQTKQNLLLKLMGFTTGWETLLFLLIGSITGLIIIFQIIHIYRNHQQKDIVYKNYSKFIEKLNYAGMSLQLSEGPEAIKQKAIKKFPKQKLNILNIIDNYIQIRYASKNKQSLILQFISDVKKFKT
ncbi:MAG: DUF3488 and transglutaminase-like domain-containing protein [Gammaproteobacteria bacterium]|nr:DUF3488 and transglutaminase-like domain-containing protein [Gammaproteobacteria bacterium]